MEIKFNKPNLEDLIKIFSINKIILI